LVGNDERGSEQVLRLGDFARLFGTSNAEVQRFCYDEILGHDFRYSKLEPMERDEVILRALKRINSVDLPIAGAAGSLKRWEKGWKGNLAEINNPASVESGLIPKYFKKNQPLRLYQEFVKSPNPDFELDWFDVFRRWLFKKYLAKPEQVYEFGCGTGNNLALLGRLFPDKTMYGLDWAVSSKKIVDRLAKIRGWNIQGKIFDFFSPDQSLKMPENSAVLTIDALEQTDSRYEKFLQFLIKKSPAVCIHVEPIVEWYDENNLIDYLAILHHRRRRYLEGFVNRLKSLESQRRIRILKLRRSYFGSTLIEGYSQVIWQPVAGH